MSTLRITDDMRTRLHELENEHGQLTPDAVLEDAKRKDSPLHDAFEWDVKKAARSYWLDTAREIIRSVKVVVTDERITVRTPHYVRDGSLPADAQGYVSVATLKKDPDKARESLKVEFARIEGALARVRSIAEALGMSNEVEDLISHVVRVKEHAQAA